MYMHMICYFFMLCSDFKQQSLNAFEYFKGTYELSMVLKVDSFKSRLHYLYPNLM